MKQQFVQNAVHLGIDPLPDHVIITHHGGDVMPLTACICLCFTYLAMCDLVVITLQEWRPHAPITCGMRP